VDSLGRVFYFEVLFQTKKTLDKGNQLSPLLFNTIYNEWWLLKKICELWNMEKLLWLYGL